MKFFSHITKILLVLASSASLAQSEYWLEHLVDSASSNVASPEIQSVLRSYAQEDYQDCIKQLGISEEKAEQYFSSTPTQLSKDSEVVLVFPSQYCLAFFGAHSIQFWLLEKNKDQGYKVILTARQDGFEVLESVKNSHLDIKLRYGENESVYSYNGSNYVPK